jgi:hypothetical protein
VHRAPDRLTSKALVVSVAVGEVDVPNRAVTLALHLR